MPPEVHLELESVHRFSDETYADLNLLMRTGERPAAVFDALLDRGQVVVHASDVERTAAIADVGARGDELIIADTREQVAVVNAAIRDRRQPSGDQVDEPVTRRGERIGLGDRIAPRRNDRDLGVANRDVWTVAGIGKDGSLLVVGRDGQRGLPREYVLDHVERAFASTAYGAQGQTVDCAHLVVGEGTGAAAAYVAMTRGRHRNVAHLVADSVDQARQQWIEVSAATALTSAPDTQRRGSTRTSTGTAPRSQTSPGSPSRSGPTRTSAFDRPLRSVPNLATAASVADIPARN